MCALLKLLHPGKGFPTPTEVLFKIPGDHDIQPSFRPFCWSERSWGWVFEPHFYHLEIPSYLSNVSGPQFCISVNSEAVVGKVTVPSHSSVTLMPQFLLMVLTKPLGLYTAAFGAPKT